MAGLATDDTMNTTPPQSRNTAPKEQVTGSFGADGDQNLSPFAQALHHNTQQQEQARTEGLLGAWQQLKDIPNEAGRQGGLIFNANQPSATESAYQTKNLMREMENGSATYDRSDAIPRSQSPFTQTATTPYEKSVYYDSHVGAEIASVRAKLRQMHSKSDPSGRRQSLHLQTEQSRSGVAVSDLTLITRQYNDAKLNTSRQYSLAYSLALQRQAKKKANKRGPGIGGMEVNMPNSQDEGSINEISGSLGE